MPGGTLINKNTGEPQFFLEEEMRAALASGEYAFDPERDYFFVSGGGPVKVKGAQAPEYFRRNAPVESLESQRARRTEKLKDDTFSGALGTSSAFIDGFLSGGTGGLSEVLQHYEVSGKPVEMVLGNLKGSKQLLLEQGWNPDDLTSKSFLRETRERNPTARSAGVVTGAVVGSLAGARGGAGAALPAGFASRVGVLAGKKAGAKVGTGIAGRTVAGVAEGAVDLGIYGAFQGASDAIVNDKPFVSEVLSSSFHNAVYGGLFGGGGALIGSTWEKGVGAYKQRKVAKEIETNPVYIRGTEENRQLVAETRRAFASLDDAARRIDDVLSQAKREAMAVRRSERVVQTAGDRSVTKGKTVSHNKVVEESGETVRGKIGEVSVKKAQKETTTKHIKSKAEEIGSVQRRLQKEINEFQKAVKGRRNVRTGVLDVSDDSINALYGADLKKADSVAKAVDRFEKSLKELSEQGASISGIQQISKILDDVRAPVSQFGGKASSVAPSLNTMDVIAIGNELGVDFGLVPEGSTADSLLKLYLAGRVAGGAKEFKKLREGKAPKQAGRIAGIAVGRTVGRSLRSNSPGLAGSLRGDIGFTASRYATERLFEKAFGAGKIARAAGTAEGIMRKSADKLASGVKKLKPLKPSTAKGILSRPIWQADEDKNKAPQNIREAFRQRVQELEDAASDPRRFQVKIKARISPLFLQDPELGDMILADITKKTQYLMNNVPNFSVRTSLSGKETMTINDAEINRFAKIYGAVTDPISVIERIGAGKVTSSEMDALRQTSPVLFQRMQQYILNNIQRLRKELPYQNKLIISTFLGVPVEKSMERDMLQRLQNNFFSEQEGGTKQSSSVSVKLKSPGLEFTTAQAIQE